MFREAIRQCSGLFGPYWMKGLKTAFHTRLLRPT